MAITSYATLQTAIQTWLARSDLSANVTDFISLFEAFANRRLRVRQQEASTTLTTSSGSATLPTDYLSWRKVVYPASTRVVLDYVDPTILEEMYPNSDTGTPRCFTIEGTTFKVRPVDDTTAITFVYHQKIPALSDTNTSNWLLAAHPDLYLFGSLVEAQMFTMDTEQAALWKSRRDDLIEEINRLNAKARGPASVRAQGVYTP